MEKLKTPRICAVDGCASPLHLKGMCIKHYARMRKTGTTDHPRDTRGDKNKHPSWMRWLMLRRRRILCDAWHKDFWAFVDGIGDPGESNSLQRPKEDEPFGPDNFRWSVPQTPETKVAYYREWRRKNPDGSRRSQLVKKYGITLAQYYEMLAAQDGKCAICGEAGSRFQKANGKNVRRLSVDHNHETGKVRKLICNDCNVGIGAFQEDTERMKMAIDYLVAHDSAP